MRFEWIEGEMWDTLVMRGTEGPALMLVTDMKTGVYTVNDPSAANDASGGTAPPVCTSRDRKRAQRIAIAWYVVGRHLEG